MTHRRRFAVTASGALGLALLIPALLAPARAGSLVAFNALASSRGVEFSAGPKPFIIDPTALVAAPYSLSSMSSIPASNALASLLYPGDAVQWALDEEGPATQQGLPAGYPFTLKARYPDKPDRTKAYEATVLKQIGAGVEAGKVRALATLSENIAHASVTDIRVAPDPASGDVVRAGQVRTENHATNDGRLLTQSAEAVLTDVVLLGGIITIEEIRSSAVASSDGSTNPALSADIRFKGVRVHDMNGGAHQAVIDESGIRIEDPALSPQLNQALNVRLAQTLAKGQVTIVANDATTTSSGPTSQAFAGGLSIRLRTGTCDACYSILASLPPIPAEIRSQVPEIAVCPPGLPLPNFCLTPNLVPFPPDLEATVTLGNVSVLAGASAGLTFGGGPSGPADPPFTPPTEVLGERFYAPPSTSPPVQQPGFTAQPPVAQPGAGAPVQLTGLVSKIPSAALVVPGALLLVLAVGLALVPALGREAAA